MNRLGAASVLVVVILSVSVTASDAIARSPKKSRIAAAKADVSNILGALQMYKIENGDYPSAAQGLLALVERPVGKPEALNWQEGGYLDRLVKDPWGRPYLYRNPGVVDPVEVFSLGRDGVSGGSGECADIYSSGFESTNSRECKPQELRRHLAGIAVIVVGLVLIVLIRKLFKSVDGNLYEFIARLFIWFVGLVVFVLMLGLFLPVIY